jgi:hypothetical protein
VIRDQALYDKLVRRIRVDEKTGCWLWTGPIRPSKWPQNQYGLTSHNGRTLCAHRAMVIALYGPQPKHICACHRCDVPLCINPEHLFLGTMGNNIRDSRSKNRHHEAQKEFCERGHPLFGDNLTLGQQHPPKKGIRRVCKACHLGRQRMRNGWPEHMAYDINIRVPRGYRLDRETCTIVPWRGRQRTAA